MQSGATKEDVSSSGRSGIKRKNPADVASLETAWRLRYPCGNKILSRLPNILVHSKKDETEFDRSLRQAATSHSLPFIEQGRGEVAGRTLERPKHLQFPRPSASHTSTYHNVARNIYPNRPLGVTHPYPLLDPLPSETLRPRYSSYPSDFLILLVPAPITTKTESSMTIDSVRRKLFSEESPKRLRTDAPLQVLAPRQTNVPMALNSFPGSQNLETLNISNFFRWPFPSTTSSNLQISRDSPKNVRSYHPPFQKGSIIKVGNVARLVEDMTIADFVKAAAATSSSMGTPLISSITFTPPGENAAIHFKCYERKSQFVVLVPVDQPFFIIDCGWSSCCPPKTFDKYELTVRRLQVGDRCVVASKGSEDVSPPAASVPRSSTSLVPNTSAVSTGPRFWLPNSAYAINYLNEQARRLSQSSGDVYSSGDSSTQMLMDASSLTLSINADCNDLPLDLTVRKHPSTRT